MQADYSDSLGSDAAVWQRKPSLMSFEQVLIRGINPIEKGSGQSRYPSFGTLTDPGGGDHPNLL